MQSISQAKMEWMPQVLSWQLLRAESETASQILLTCELAGENKSLLQTPPPLRLRITMLLTMR